MTEQPLKNLIITGDRVLIKPIDQEQVTNSGLVLPSTVTESDKVRSGQILKVGPGYLTANPEYSSNKPWTEATESVRYLPLQAQVGDFAYYLKNEVVELKTKGVTYYIVRHASIVALMRPDADNLLESLKDINK